MRRLLCVTLALLILAPAADAARKKAKAGKVNDGVYTDAKYDFTLKVHDNWKISIKKDKENVRLTMIQKKYGVPADYIDAPDNTEVPKLTIIVDTCSLGPHAFLDSLVSRKFKSKQKSRIVGKFDLLQQQEIIPKGRKRWEVGELSGLIWTGQSKYIKEVQTSASSVGGKRVYGSYGGIIAAIKRGDNVILVHMMCEWSFFDNVMAEVRDILAGLDLEPKAEKTKAEDKS